MPVSKSVMNWCGISLPSGVEHVQLFFRIVERHHRVARLRERVEHHHRLPLAARIDAAGDLLQRAVADAFAQRQRAVVGLQQVMVDGVMCEPGSESWNWLFNTSFQPSVSACRG